MSQAMPLPEKITTVQQNRKARVLAMSFGGGYTQTAPNGTNPIFATYQIAWNNLILADRNTVVAAINATAGCDYFTWTPNAEDDEKKFIIPPEAETTLYTEDITEGQYFTIGLTLRQIP
jgi:phage-related protein